MTFTQAQSSSDWQHFLSNHSESHLLQSREWGQLKAEFDWDTERIVRGESGTQILFRHLPFGLKMAYIPEGPIGRFDGELLSSIDQICRQRGAFMLKVEPDQAWSQQAASEMTQLGFTPSIQTIQPQRSLLIDLKPDEESILAQMHSKTRYNIRLAKKKGVVVRPSDDVEAFGAMIQLTAERNRFGAHTTSYYRRAFDLFRPEERCQLFLAKFDGQMLAAIMVFRSGNRAWYFYGASTDLERNRMPTYLLQWEAIRWARSHGCTSYDLWGVPDEEFETLESEFATRSDGLWGVYRFKRGFGGQLTRTLGAWDRPYRRAYYFLYSRYARR